MPTLNIPVEMDDQDFEDHVHGSGWSSYSWWRQYRSFEDGTPGDDAFACVKAQDPDTDKFIGRTFTKAEIVAAMEKAASEYPVVARGIVASDLDADAMDIVMQIAAFGTVTYG